MYLEKHKKVLRKLVPVPKHRIPKYRFFFFYMFITEYINIIKYSIAILIPFLIALAGNSLAEGQFPLVDDATAGEGEYSETENDNIKMTILIMVVFLSIYLLKKNFK
jgi:hypothetical protein